MALKIIPLLAAGGWFAALENSNSSASLALGRPKWLAAANAAKVVGMMVLVPLGGHLGGFHGAIVALAVVLVFTVLLFEFGNFAAPIAVISSALLSTCGVFLALLVTGTTFNLSSFMGLIMVIGIVAKNGILLLDADQRFRAAKPRRSGNVSTK